MLATLCLSCTCKRLTSDQSRGPRHSIFLIYIYFFFPPSFFFFYYSFFSFVFLFLSAFACDVPFGFSLSLSLLLFSFLKAVHKMADWKNPWLIIQRLDARFSASIEVIWCVTQFRIVVEMLGKILRVRPSLIECISAGYFGFGTGVTAFSGIHSIMESIGWRWRRGGRRAWRHLSSPASTTPNYNFNSQPKWLLVIYLFIFFWFTDRNERK